MYPFKYLDAYSHEALFVRDANKHARSTPVCPHQTISHFSLRCVLGTTYRHLSILGTPFSSVLEFDTNGTYNLRVALVFVYNLE